ncbi:MAG TPA: hypothetical protein VFC07_06765 [Verrucomicrobiae bacterium]|nr:hypothetical protein [Verrucomicrobiae bacterium]
MSRQFEKQKDLEVAQPNRRWGCFITLSRAAALLQLLLVIGLGGPRCAAASIPAQELFQQGSASYVTNGFEPAAALFLEAASVSPAAGTLHNLGNAEWQTGRPGPAILAWERAQWITPFSSDTRANLRYARKARQLDAPELAWYEICSTWLPVNAWAWIACVSFWLAVAMIMLPGVLGWRKADWHQGVAAAGFAVFLLTLPALAGVHTRSKLGVILPQETPLLLTPTSEAQILTRLPAGETARLERERGSYVFIRTGAAAGWVGRAQFGLMCGNY